MACTACHQRTASKRCGKRDQHRRRRYSESAPGFWVATPQALRNQLLHFFKNIALAGGFVLLAQVPRQS